MYSGTTRGRVLDSSTTSQDHMPHVEQQSHGCTTLASKHAIILRPQKFVHHSCEYTQRCTMLVLTIVRPSVIESVAHGRL